MNMDIISCDIIHILHIYYTIYTLYKYCESYIHIYNISHIYIYNISYIYIYNMSYIYIYNISHIYIYIHYISYTDIYHTPNQPPPLSYTLLYHIFDSLTTQHIADTRIIEI